MHMANCLALTLQLVSIQRLCPPRYLQNSCVDDHDDHDGGSDADEGASKNRNFMQRVAFVCAPCAKPKTWQRLRSIRLDSHTSTAGVSFLYSVTKTSLCGSYKKHWVISVKKRNYNWQSLSITLYCVRMYPTIHPIQAKDSDCGDNRRIADEIENEEVAK